jgi:peptidoglycan hydrolase-like protein with peptidoglycan-binding domain
VSLLVGIVALAAGALAGLRLADYPTPETLAPSEGPSTVAVEPRVFDDPRTASVLPITSEEVALASPAEGMVRTTECHVGEPISSGDVVAVVDNRPLVALALQSPPWRDLEVGDKGEDVKDLQGALVALGYEAPVTGAYDWEMGRAVAKVWGKLGGPANQTAFPASQVLWLPQESVTPSECGAVVGHRIAVGDPLVRSGGSVEALRVTLPGDRYPGARVASFDSLSVPVGEDGVIDDAGFVAAFVGSPEFVAAQEASDWRNLVAQTSLADPIDVVAVPPSALYTVNGATACVLDSGTALPVEIVASELGQTMVSGGVLPNRVELSPVPEANPCW